MCVPLLACSAGGGYHGDGTGGDGGTGHGDAGHGGGPDGGGGGVDMFMPCSATSVDANTIPRPVDIVWVIDSSGSMDGEAHIIQDNLNSFSASIGSLGIDYHVVVITSSTFVSVPSPLGTDTAHFLFLNHDIASHEPLQGFIEYWSEYSAFLRPMSQLHLIATTDDESDLSAASFESMMSGLLGADHTDWLFHGIASENATHSVGPCPFCITQPGCSGPNGDAANVGAQYYVAAMDRGGLTFSICTTDWSSLFSELAMTVSLVGSIPCTFAMPDPPAGMVINTGEVNVEYTPSGAPMGGYFPYIPGGAGACPGGGDGWYYDDPTTPTEIRLCPDTCARVDADTGGRVDIALGCSTILH